MIDYLQAEKHFGCKDTIYLGNCRKEAEYSSGWGRYSLPGCKNVDVWVNDAGSLKVGGSVLYFVKGHNFRYSKGEFVEGINQIGDLLHINLWDCLLNELEYGTIISTQMAAKNYIKNHFSGKGLTLETDSPFFRQWKGKNIRLKMYDAGRNIQHKQGTSMKAIIRGEGWNPNGNYLKFEAHYIKPEKQFTRGIGIKIADIVRPEWERTLQEDLYNLYKRLIPMKTLNEPTNKKDLSAIDIALSMVVEEGINAGKTIHEIRKEVYGKINSYSDEVLSKTDKNSRKSTMKKALDKMQESELSKYDISTEIKESFTKTINDEQN